VVFSTGEVLTGGSKKTAELSRRGRKAILAGRLAEIRIKIKV
jgi:hypothetical protein